MSALDTANITPANEIPAEPARSIWQDAWKRLTGRRVTLIALIIVGIYAACAALSFTPLLDTKVQTPIADSYHPPSFSSFGMWAGTDIVGRSVMWRVIYGTRIALTIALVASAITIALGVLLGVLAGYYRGWVDDIITWLFTTISSVPWILLVVALIYVFKKTPVFGHTIPELFLVIFALGFTDWVGLCRLMRGEVLKHRDRDYVHAARAAGLGNSRILFRHILPNTVHIVIINFTLGAIGYVQAEVALTFLGLGISDKPSWGRMIDDAKLELLKGVWWQATAATLAIAILCLALNFLGDALRDALDPKLRGVD